MNLQDVLYGAWTPPNIPGRLISTDDPPRKRRSIKSIESFKEFGRRATVQKKAAAIANAERIKTHLIANPWATANEIGKALGLTKSPVYSHLTRFRDENKLEISTRRVGYHMLVSYKWIDGK